MSSKFKLREPIVGVEMERSKELCAMVVNDIDQFQTDIHYLDANQLFKQCFVDRLILIAKNLDELIYLLLGLVKPNSVYFYALKESVGLINMTPNVFIITAHYLHPENKYKRLLHKFYFDQELEQIKSKVNLVNKNLKKISKIKNLKI